MPPRFVANGLSKAFNSPTIVENKVGASGIIGTEYVVRSPADGHTILLTFSSHYINQWAMKPPFDAVKDFEPLAQLSLTPMVLTTSTNSPYKTLADVLNTAKRSPGKVMYAATAGVSQMAGAYMASMAGVDMTHVLYKDATRVLVDVASGIAELGFGSITTALPFVESGRLQVLAVGTKSRMGRFPAIPTMAEAGVPGYELSSRIMMLAPKGTPAPVIEKLSRAIVELGRSDGFKQLCHVQVCEVEVADAGALRASAPSDLEKWGKLVGLTNLNAN